MEPLVLAAMLDELDKIAASYRAAGHMQARSGTRPIRVHNLLGKSQGSDQGSDRGFVDKDATTQAPETEQPASPEMEGDELGKEAKDKGVKQKALEGFAKSRPYVVGGIKAGVPAAVFGKILVGDGPKGSKAARVAGLVGAGLGVGNEYMKDWAEKNKRRSVAKKLLED